MVDYTCIKCNKIFKQRNDYRRHINRKIPCKGNSPKNEQIKLVESQNDHFESFKSTLPVINIKYNIPKNIDGYECRYCGKYFTLKTNCTRHEKNTCRELKKNKENQMITEIENLRKQFEDFSKKCDQKSSTIHINNNIQINPFGKENINYIKDEQIKNAIRIPHYGLPNLIRLIHFNRDHPENMNIKQKNKKKPMIEVYNGDEWVTMDKQDTIHSIVATKKEMMDNYFENSGISEDLKINYEKFSQSVDAYLNGQLPKSNCFDSTSLTTKCKELYKSFVYRIDVLLANRGQFP